MGASSDAAPPATQAACAAAASATRSATARTPRPCAAKKSRAASCSGAHGVRLQRSKRSWLRRSCAYRREARVRRVLLRQRRAAVRRGENKHQLVAPEGRAEARLRPRRLVPRPVCRPPARAACRDAAAAARNARSTTRSVERPDRRDAPEHVAGVRGVASALVAFGDAAHAQPQREPPPRGGRVATPAQWRQHTAARHDTRCSGRATHQNSMWSKPRHANRSLRGLCRLNCAAAGAMSPDAAAGAMARGAARCARVGP